MDFSINAVCMHWRNRIPWSTLVLFFESQARPGVLLLVSRTNFHPLRLGFVRVLLVICDSVANRLIV